MKRFMAFLLAMFLLSTSAVCTEKYKITDVVREPDGSGVSVYFSGKSPAQSTAAVANNWSVAVFPVSGPVQTVTLTVPPDASINGRVFLRLPSTVNEKDCVIVQFLLESRPIGNSCSSASAPNQGFLVPAQDKKAADLYINGSYSPALNGPPQWSIDSYVTLACDLPCTSPATKDRGRIGVLGEVKTDKRKTADPDSYRISPLYQYVLYSPTSPVGKGFHLQGILLNYPFAGVEFDRKADDTNFITAPDFEFPVRLVPFQGAITPATKNISVVTLIAGVEAGHNFSNLVSSQGSGGVFRGLLGADFVYNFKPKLLFFDGFSITSGYRLRLPAKDEVFTLVTKDAKGNPIDSPFLSSKARHRIESELDLNLNKGFAIAITHEYGDVPPVFRFVDHKVSIGLTYMLQQGSGVRAAIRKK